jgi:hypothetical protein
MNSLLPFNLLPQGQEPRTAALLLPLRAANMLPANTLQEEKKCGDRPVADPRLFRCIAIVRGTSLSAA